MSPFALTAAAERLLADARVAWSIGRPGAIAEFSWNEDEPVSRGTLAIASARGAFRLDLPGTLQIFAGEALGHGAGVWSQWIAFCLPADAATLTGRTTLTELGHDLGASRAEDRAAVLFDLGIGGAYYQLCVRTSQAAELQLLRAAVGKVLLAEDDLIHALVEMSPARVFESRCARIDVMQAIATPEGVSPEGPHTHLLPSLLADPAEDRTVPYGWVAQAMAYPAHPVRDRLGQPQPFDAAAFAAFQSWLEDFGDPGHLSVKRLVIDAVRSGRQPGARSGQIDDAGRDSVRIALRQLHWLDGESRALAHWRAVYDE